MHLIPTCPGSEPPSTLVRGRLIRCAPVNTARTYRGPAREELRRTPAFLLRPPELILAGVWIGPLVLISSSPPLLQWFRWRPQADKDKDKDVAVSPRYPCDLSRQRKQIEESIYRAINPRPPHWPSRIRRLCSREFNRFGFPVPSRRESDEMPSDCLSPCDMTGADAGSSSLGATEGSKGAKQDRRPPLRQLGILQGSAVLA
ncbi:hypothetical protein BO71DRAFT_176172 [Aspergillus ellipticus CBS 707.79]|uniref:Uncharacterized protein n=1 Tax=Aspergillus ellipticus CBS 707.79 TaxID=1448320 RepID=A0A319DHA2_9EURO|nr:hypothetical protein BO71DRAFT_176172 [Aspergillus ellipticus CBS 707.79]